jgi:hypothetical protein
MAQDAEYGCAEDEWHPLLGGQESSHPFGPANRLRWVCGASPSFPDGVPVRRPREVGEPGGGPGEPDGQPTPAGPVTPAWIPERSRVVPRPRSGQWYQRAEPDPGGGPEGHGGGLPGAGGPEQGAAADERHRSGCRADRPGWAGGHRHGAVRPPRRIIRRDRPARRWC